MRHYAPRSIAFLGKRACSVMIGRPNVDWAASQLSLPEPWPGFFPTQVVLIEASCVMLSLVLIRNCGLRSVDRTKIGATRHEVMRRPSAYRHLLR
jgi:hypothetical protein